MPFTAPFALEISDGAATAAYRHGEELPEPLVVLVKAAVKAVKPKTNPNLLTTLYIARAHGGFAVQTVSTSRAGKSTRKETFVPAAEIERRAEARRARGARGYPGERPVEVVREVVVVERPVEVVREAALECQVCFERRLDSVLPCGHTFCDPCARGMAAANGACAVCRGSFGPAEIKRIYF